MRSQCVSCRPPSNACHSDCAYHLTPASAAAAPWLRTSFPSASPLPHTRPGERRRHTAPAPASAAGWEWLPPFPLSRCPIPNQAPWAAPGIPQVCWSLFVFDSVILMSKYGRLGLALCWRRQYQKHEAELEIGGLSYGLDA
jgi:hypothetical protein